MLTQFVSTLEGAIEMRKRALVGLAALLALLVFSGMADDVFAAVIYGTANTGYDISYPQCGNAYPAAPFGFGIVGVTHGHAFTKNECLASEFAWAQQGTSAAPSLYMNINYAIGTTASNGNTGPAGTCARGDKACIAYNYGYNAALDAFNYATSQSVSAQNWWLDVETSNSWNAKTDLNDRVIQGAIDLLVSKSLTVGVYSTKSQWTTIAGSTWKPLLPNGASLPNWVATNASNSAAASTYCSATYAFGGGTVWLVQYASGGFDANYSC